MLEKLQPSVDPEDPQTSVSMRQDMSEILEPITKMNEGKAADILNAVTHTGQMTWNNIGEVVNPATNRPIKNSNISQILKYDLAKNKNEMKKPTGYNFYKNAKNASREKTEELHSDRKSWERARPRHQATDKTGRKGPEPLSKESVKRRPLTRTAASRTMKGKGFSLDMFF